MVVPLLVPLAAEVVLDPIALSIPEQAALAPPFIVILLLFTVTLAAAPACP